MVALDVDEILAAIDGRLLHPGGEGCRVRGVAIDSRVVTKGQAFFAIVGQRTDGHLFVEDARAAGAALIVVERDSALSPLSNIPVARVQDTTRALGQLAHTWRRQVDPTVVGITGSLGKTTTKELTQQILKLRGPTQHTRGNQNNHIGVPLTLLELDPTTRFAVLELGMSGLGEIRYLGRLAQPDVACMTGVAPVHLEQLGTMEAVAQAKAEIIDSLGDDGMLIHPAEEPLLEPFVSRLPPDRRIAFGRTEGCEVRIREAVSLGRDGSQIELELRGKPLRLILPLPGVHHAQNAAAAAAIALALGIDPELIAMGLSVAPELGHRSKLLQVGRFHVLDDCYNASPVAMKAALRALVDLAGDAPRVALLGQMRELGGESSALHYEVGQAAAACELELLITVGPEAADIGRGAVGHGMDAAQVRAAGSVEEAVALLSDLAPKEIWVLVKASRGAELERVIPLLSQLPMSG